ncbi:TAT-dependent nitrous-oxide reductase [Halobacterium rubrum]|uniref:TAT-dependent nitrous-oxide reductase n=1 Tax=Halobacterium TaxID=2239 RepID=UPI001F2C93A6|nr:MULTISPECIES: TAT-dependent nitrous-oxide reductase [Halobacterium]MDH5020625.1 TAT-dependent nitrous-oxide reductase [Halobacterium rubrum]MDH5020654.1 TAT-dependent nitrous-oxide reductase [Halobacterium rubrum]
MTEDSDTDQDTVPDPEEVVQRHERQLDAALAEVQEPTPSTDESLDLELPGLELHRRDFVKAGAATGAMAGLAGCSGGLLDSGGSDSGSNGGGTGANTDYHVPPGEKDTYYGFWSGGHSGEVRVVGVPSMREIRRIPVFQKEGGVGYGHDEKTKQVLEEGGDIGSVAGYEWGDSHHPVLSETDGDYDGRWLFINDKGSGRVARIDLKYFETDAITDVPNMQACHGMAVQSPDTEYVYGIGEFRVPIPNDGTDYDDPDDYWSVFAALDPETMTVEWQVRVDGNLDNADTGKDGEWAFATGYNKEHAVDAEGMTHDDRDFMKAFNIPAIEAAVEAGNYEEVNGVPVVDGRQDSQLNQGDDPVVKYVPTPKSPHGCDVEPQGRYVTASGKLSPTVTIVDIDELADASDPAEAIVGQPKVGLGPLHTTFDGRGNAYTTLFIDSQVAKWDIEAAVDAEKGSTDPISGKIDVHYNPGHLQAVESETTDPAGDWLISLNKLSKDRFISTGPIHPDNDQLIDISEDASSSATGGMELVADHPVHPEPHDCVVAHRDKINPNNVWDRADYEGEKPFVTQDASGVERTGDQSVEVQMSSSRSQFGLQEFTVQEGDEVSLTVTNIEDVRDIIHGLAIPQYGINLAIAPQDTRQVTFEASEPGVYWVYCTFFCSALHLEMRSRMIVEPSDS